MPQDDELFNALLTRAREITPYGTKRQIVTPAMQGGGKDQPRTPPVRQDVPHQYDSSVARTVGTLGGEWLSSQRNALQQQMIASRQRIDADRAAAVADYTSRANSMRDAAQTATQNARGFSFDLSPLQSITRVALNPTLSGANTATQQFSLAPESVQSQFTVGGGTGSDQTGTRQKQTTGALSKTGTDDINLEQRRRI